MINEENKTKKLIEEIEKMKQELAIIREENDLYKNLIIAASKNNNINIEKKFWAESIHRGRNELRKKRIKLERACRFYGKSRQAYYKKIKSKKKSKEIFLKEIVEEVLKIRTQFPNIGVRKMYAIIKPILNQKSIKLGRDALFDIVRDITDKKQTLKEVTDV